MFSFIVEPVSVISTIASDRPTSGASSTEPFRNTISGTMFSFEKNFFVIVGYFVAILISIPAFKEIRLPFWHAKTILHLPIGSDTGSYTSQSASIIQSDPTIPQSAAPSSTYLGTSDGLQARI